jgi:cell wall-associated NlpC family hydrolase
MGTPYRWGGSDANGFDCSGLIQYAFAEHGIPLPRQSREQASAGYEVGRHLSSLLPGDILTFSAQPGQSEPVTHVGLYLGDGRFIHSATGGVQVSELNASTAVSGWWLDRWVGARRVNP